MKFASFFLLVVVVIAAAPASAATSYFGTYIYGRKRVFLCNTDGTDKICFASGTGLGADTHAKTTVYFSFQCTPGTGIGVLHRKCTNLTESGCTGCSNAGTFLTGKRKKLHGWGSFNPWYNLSTVYPNSINTAVRQRVFRPCSLEFRSTGYKCFLRTTDGSNMTAMCLQNNSLRLYEQHLWPSAPTTCVSKHLTPRQGNKYSCFNSYINVQKYDDLYEPRSGLCFGTSSAAQYTIGKCYSTNAHRSFDREKWDCVPINDARVFTLIESSASFLCTAVVSVLASVILVLSLV